MEKWLEKRERERLKDALLIIISDKPRLVQEAERSKVFVGIQESARYGMFWTGVLCAAQSRHLFFFFFKSSLLLQTVPPFLSSSLIRTPVGRCLTTGS